MKKTQKKKAEAFASSGGSKSDYVQKDYNRGDYSNINHIYGLNQNNK